MKHLLFDTSAVRGLRRLHFEALEALSDRYRLELSPISVWEIICHLDDDKPWKQARGHLLACRHFHLRDDPFAELGARTGIAALVHRSRFEDKRLLPKVIEAAAEAETLSEFYACTIEDEFGRRTVSDLAAKTRAILEDEERRFIESMRCTMAILCDSMRKTGASEPTPVDFFDVAMATAEDLAARSRAQGHEDEQLREMFFIGLYAHAGYRVARAMFYLKKARFTGEWYEVPTIPVALDVNDTEDSYIALHLSLHEDVTFVSGDGGGIGALRAARQAISALAGHMGTPELIGFKVMENQDFRRETARDATDVVAWMRSRASGEAPIEDWLHALGRLGIGWFVE